MSQTIEFEIAGEEPVSPDETRDLGKYLNTLATSDAAVSRIRLEIEAENVLGISVGEGVTEVDSEGSAAERVDEGDEETDE